MFAHAGSVLSHDVKKPSKWLQEIGKRRPLNVVAVALANKMARMIWAARAS
jgi:transposase